MYRTAAVFSGSVVIALVVYGCSSVVPLDSGFYPAQLDTGEVQVIDARSMTRASVERVLQNHHLIGRFDQSIPPGDGFETQLQEEVEKGKTTVLKAGGRTLMYTDDSELIAVLKQDARFAGAPGSITMYVLLHHR